MGGFWRTNGKKALVILAVLSLLGAGAYGQLSYSSDVEPFLTETLPEAATFELLADMAADENYLYGAFDSTGMPINYVTASEGQGYGGPMTVMVVWTLDGTIQDVQVAQHNDTAAWFGKLTSTDFYSQYIGRQYSDALKLRDDIDAASGATRSSSGVSTAVASGRLLVADQLGDPYPVPDEEVDFGTAEIALLVGLGMVFTFRMVPPFNRFHRLRIFSLAFGFIVFGVWLSSPLSLVNFAVWPVGFAPTWQSNLFLYILVGGLVSLALVFAKNFWCFWMCPFVAMQETAHFIGGGRVRPITKRQITLRNTRYFILWGVLLMVLLMRSPAISTFEPWGTIFSVEGTPEQWLLVIVTLGVAMFVYDFWCHYLCPVGATMDIILRVRMWFGDGLRRVFAR